MTCLIRRSQWLRKLRCNRFFFFQAEDGIRDVAVTGVQTCALPISRNSRACTSCFARARGCCQKSFASRNTKLGCAASSSSGGSCCCWDSPLTFVGTSPVGSLTSEASTQVEDSTPQSLASQQIGCGHVCC